MALVPKFHVVPALCAVDTVASLEIKMGMLVTITSAGVKRVEAATVGKVYGIAGDNYSTTSASMPGISPGWQNRVSDGYNETKASGEMTVYHSGGEFATDMFETGMVAADVGKYLKASVNGKLTLDGAVETLSSIAVLTRAPGAYPSGVPGTDINGDIALGGANNNQYIECKLII